EGVPDEAEAVKRFRALLDESVEMQLMSDVPLGSHLSGGLDSSAIVLRASQDLADRLKTFSVYFAEKEYDESALIEEVSLLADTIHYDLLLDPTEFPKILPRILYHLDEPRVGPSVIPQWYIEEIASKEVRVVLPGYGSDELVAASRVYPRRDACPINRSLYLDIKTYLPSLLLVEDRMSMAHSIEDRVPLLDHRIAELSAQIPGRFKIRGLTLKWIPRRSAEGVLPRSILQH